MAKVKVAVIGVGKIAEAGHLPYYQKHPEVELIALADQNEGRAREVGEKFRVNKIYSSLAELLKHESVDAISICTPNVSHIPLSIEALEHGVHVLVEKPMAIRYNEAKVLEKVAGRSKGILMVGMTHRFRNEANVIKRFVEAKEFGKLYYVKAQIMRRRGTPRGWFTDHSFSGGGTLMDIGVHALDLAWWLAGRPMPLKVSGFLYQGLGDYQTELVSSWTSAVSNTGATTFNVEDFATAFIRFEDELVLHLEVSWAMEGPQDDALKVYLYGEKGGASLDPLKVYGEKNHILYENQLIIEKNNYYEAEINHFIEAVQRREKAISSLEDGVEVVRMLEGIRRSAEKREEIDLQSL